LVSDDLGLDQGAVLSCDVGLLFAFVTYRYSMTGVHRFFTEIKT
jgi:hypothetical protein